MEQLTPSSGALVLTLRHQIHTDRWWISLGFMEPQEMKSCPSVCTRNTTGSSWAEKQIAVLGRD